MELPVDDWLAVLDELAVEPAAGDEGFRTVVEIRDAMGWSKERAHAALHRARDEGRLEIGKLRRVDLAGRNQRVPAYRVLPNKPQHGGETLTGDEPFAAPPDDQ